MPRPRWTTAKAFLFDERGGLVQEFALDPTCSVSVQDLHAAGAFAALGAPVHVGRYFAQTVRVDGLALTVVGNVPPEIDQIEFLRNLLHKLQDRFEDRIKDRLEVARAEEARIEAERSRVARQVADVRRRSEAVSALYDAIAKAAARMAASTADLAARHHQLVEREERAKVLDPKVHTLDAREAEVGRQAEALLSVQKALREREAELEALTARLQQQDQELQEREAQADRFFEELAAKVAKNARWERDLANKAASLKAREEGTRGADEDRGKKEPARVRR